MRRPKQAQPTTTSPVQARGGVAARNKNLVSAPGRKKGCPAIKRYTLDETLRQTAIVEECLVYGRSEAEMIRSIARDGMTVGVNRVRSLKARVHERMKLEGERTRPMTREKQLRRLYAELADARGEKDPCTGMWKVKPHWSAVTRIEMLIAQVEGNFEPIKLDIDVVHREALTNVLTSITAEQASAMLVSYDRLATLAEAAAHAQGVKMPSLLPAPTKDVITVFTQGSSSAAE